MEPNNNQPFQPMNTNPLGQPVAPQPVAPPPSPIPPEQQPTPGSIIPDNPGQGNNKGILLLIILIILIAGMGYYAMFAKNQINTDQKVATENKTTVIPAATPTPEVTPATVEEVNIASPDADLNGIQTDVQGL